MTRSDGGDIGNVGDIPFTRREFAYTRAVQLGLEPAAAAERVERVLGEHPNLNPDEVRTWDEWLSRPSL